MSILIFPGLNGSGPGHWQQHWANTLPDAHIVDMGDWDAPDRARWVARGRAAILRHPGSLLVGHSLGAILIAHLAAAGDLPIAGALLVAPADVEQPMRTPDFLRSFAPLPVRPLGIPATLVGSRNDPYMSLARARVLASLWETGFVDAGRAGHINIDSGHGAWDEGRRLLDRFSAAARAAA